MLILALDTTTRAGSVAVTADDDVLAVVEGDPTRTHGERLPGEIDRALTEAGVTGGALNLIAVASGPGAFTGLRIGLAAVQGLAMVLDVPVVGVSALDALAALAWPDLRSAPAGIRMTWMDAQRGEVFAAQYEATPATDDPWSPSRTPLVGSPASVLATLDRSPATRVAFAGEGAVRYEAAITEWSNGSARVMRVPMVLAPMLARLGRHRAGRGHAGPPHALQPLYIRRPDAELERARRQP